MAEPPVLEVSVFALPLDGPDVAAAAAAEPAKKKEFKHGEQLVRLHVFLAALADISPDPTPYVSGLIPRGAFAVETKYIPGIRRRMQALRRELTQGEYESVRKILRGPYGQGPYSGWTDLTSTIVELVRARKKNRATVAAVHHFLGPEPLL